MTSKSKIANIDKLSDIIKKNTAIHFIAQSI